MREPRVRRALLVGRVPLGQKPLPQQVREQVLGDVGTCALPIGPVMARACPNKYIANQVPKLLPP